MMKYNKLKKQSGFTLIEALIVAAILAIIALLGINFYDDQKRRGYRSDAIIAIQTVAQLQERNRTVNGRYDTLANINANSTSPEGFYDITLSNLGTETYTITATAPATSAQINDTACRSFSLTHTGIRSSTDSGGTTTTGGDSRCWPR